MKKPDTALKLLLCAAAIFYLVFVFRTGFDVHGQRYFTLVDDAMISMRYARNLAQGHGAVWNVGEPPVEGFTNPGWMLVMAALHLIPFPPPFISLAVMLTAGILLLVNIWIIYRIVGMLDPDAPLAPLIAATLTAFYFPLVFWTLRGLEVGALTLTLALALLLALRLTRDRFDGLPLRGLRSAAAQGGPGPATVTWLSLVLGLALLVRMDAILPVSLILIYIGAQDRSKALIPAVTVGMVLAAILILQKTYFGDFLPNTYYLKVYGVAAWERIRVGLLSLSDYASRDLLMPLVLALIGLATIKELRSREALLLLSLFLMQTAYSVWVGGDYAEELIDSANRFITQGMSALFILFALVIDRLIRNTSGAQVKPVLAVMIGLGMLLVVSGEPWTKWVIGNAPMLRTDVQRVKLGLHIQANTDPRAVVAVHAAGQIPYFSLRTTIDLLGKSDPLIAKGPPATAFAAGHNKWNYEYSILQLKPDVIADNFNKFSGFISGVPEYMRLTSGIYVRTDSTLVDAAGLSADYK